MGGQPQTHSSLASSITSSYFDAPEAAEVPLSLAPLRALRPAHQRRSRELEDPKVFQETLSPSLQVRLWRNSQITREDAFRQQLRPCRIQATPRHILPGHINNAEAMLK